MRRHLSTQSMGTSTYTIVRDQGIDRFVARTGIAFTQAVDAARRKKNGTVDAATGRDISNRWAREMRLRYLNGRRWGVQTGIPGPTGGGDLRSMRLFDLVFVVGSAHVGIEVQTTNYDEVGHKPHQVSAQEMWVSEVMAPNLAYAYKIYAGNGKEHLPVMKRYSAFGKWQDLSRLLR